MPMEAKVERLMPMHRRLFGGTVSYQSARRALDERAYFCLIDVKAISHVVHMTPQFVNGDSVEDYTCWLQTVTVP